MSGEAAAEGIGASNLGDEGYLEVDGFEDKFVFLSLSFLHSGREFGDARR